MTATAAPPRAPETVAVTPGPQRRANALAGTGPLLRFNLRRDRVRLPVWLGALVLGTLALLSSFQQSYPAAADRAALAETLDNPSGLAMSGPAHYLGDYGFGSVMSHQLLGIVAMLVGLMSALVVVRHTRTEEETGRAELVRAAVVGRHAHLTAALAVAVLANLVLAVLLALALGTSGAEGVNWHGSLLYGAAHAAAGIAFAGAAAVTVQITQHARGASGMALAVIGVAYALRAVGDVGNGALSWLSPIGWAQRTYAYVDNRWWPLLLDLALAAAAAAAGYLLSTRRDVGAGLRAARPGRRVASRMLRRPVGLALRQQRGLLYGFSAGLFLIGAMYGSMLGRAEETIQDLADVREAVERIGGTSVTESVAAMVMMIVAVVASVHVALAAQRPRAEESAGRAESLLTAGVSRTGWLGSQLAVAMAGGTAVLLVAGVGFGLLGTSTTGEGRWMTDLPLAALAYAPALWVTAGAAVALFGWLPRATAAVWVLPVHAFVFGYLGEILDFPDWLGDLSPFSHVPQLPAQGMAWAPMLALTAVAAALAALGLVGFNRRDLETK